MSFCLWKRYKKNGCIVRIVAGKNRDEIVVLTVKIGVNILLYNFLSLWVVIWDRKATYHRK